MSHFDSVLLLIERVRARWRRLMLLQSAARAGFALAGVLAFVLLAAAWTTGVPLVLAALVVAAALAAVAAVVWAFWPARAIPSDGRVARFVEEREQSLDDRLVSAAELASSGAPSTMISRLFTDDVGRRASEVDPAAIVPSGTLRRAGLQAAASLLLVAVIAFAGRATIRQAVDALSLRLFPSRIALEVTPGSVRLPSGSPLTIEARLVGNTAPVVAQVLRAPLEAGAEPADWVPVDMTSAAPATFTLALESVEASFRYRVAAGAARSEVFEVQVARPPRVARIDVEYSFPAALKMSSKVEEDTGDIYAPAGTDVRIRVRTEGEAATGNMTLSGGRAIALTPDPPMLVSETLRIVEDGSYRVALADREGLKNPGDTEYFIRVLEDRPPDVHVVRPARDRAVTRLEEVDIEAEAEDDHGVDRLELVYAIRGGAERAIPLRIDAGRTAVNGRHTLYLEDLDVRPGDFVSYYVRARDVARGKRPSEVRSDIFFLEVKPFEQEFALARSQGAGAGGGNRSIDDLVAAQKEIIVATWKLDRRSQAASGAQSEKDIRAVGRAESELKTRVEQTSSSFRDSTMRDPRRSQPPRTGAPAGRAALPEEDAMTAAALAMGRAVEALDRVKTADALPPEMEALNHLLRAQADVKRREVMRQQAGSGGGQNRASQDLSNLFDKELARQQQTNYETPTTTEQRDEEDGDLESIRELARRQDEVLRRQQELARRRDQMTPEALKRELEQLTREQTELRRRAEELARQLEKQNQQSAAGNQQSAGRNQQGAGQSQQGAGQSQQGAGRSQQGTGQNQQGAAQNQQSAADRMREASRAMEAAAGDLRRQDPKQASASGGRALQELQEVQQQMQRAQPDERRRAMGDMQLEARQLADEQRAIAAEQGKAAGGDKDADTRRRLAGDQERLAERTRRLQSGLQEQANAPVEGGRGRRPGQARAESRADDRAAAEQTRNAAREATRQIDQQRLVERMQQSASSMRGSAGGDSNASSQTRREQEEVARALDRLADRIAGAVTPGDEASRRMTDQLTRAQDLRDQIDSLTRKVERLAEQGGRGATGDAARLRDDYNRRLQEARELLDQIGRDNPEVRTGGLGFTFEGQGMVMSAPGTEPFKQDFTQWEQLRKQVTLALDRAESELSRRLQARDTRDRLAAGVDDQPPAGYQDQVDSYFKSLAGRKPR